MRRANNTEQIIKEDLSFAASAAMHDRILNDVLAAQKESQKIGSALAKPNIRSIIMKSPITKLATAAIVAIACLIGLSLWKGTESGIALADVLARVEKVKAVRYKTGFKITGGDPNKPYNVEIRSTSLTSQEYGSKTTSEQNDPNGGVSKFEFYTLPQKKTRINIGHKNKTYRRFELDDVQIERIQKELDIRDWVAFLKKIVGSKYKSLGISTIDGNEVEVFQTTDPNCTRAYFKNPQVDVKIWVDVKTKLIVRYEESITEQMGDRYLRHQLVMYDFQWDVPVDPAEFEPVIPDGYTGTVVNWAAITEPNAIQRLKQCVELFGNYPESIDRGGLFSALKKSKTPAALRLKEEIKGLTDEEKAKRIIWDPALPIQCLDRFRFGLIADGKDPAYYGKTVTPKDADKVLMRWKVSDNEYRVIYGDLRAETVTSAKLAELEKLNPQVPLHLAARAGDIERVKLLISKGADVNAKDGRGFTPLHQACFTRLGRAVAELLIAQGANMNAKITDVNDGRTPLHVAAWSGNVPVAELLIAKGVDIDAKENNGGTPLHRACLHSHKVVVELLLAKGADLNVKDNKGQTALSLAKERKYEEIVELLRKHGAKE